MPTTRAPRPWPASNREPALLLKMLGGTRNGRALKLALLVGLVLLTLYFLVSWKREAQTLSTNLELAEQEYATFVKRYNRLEEQLKGEQVVAVDGRRALLIRCNACNQLDLHVHVWQPLFCTTEYLEF